MAAMQSNLGAEDDAVAGLGGRGRPSSWSRSGATGMFIHRLSGLGHSGGRRPSMAMPAKEVVGAIIVVFGAAEQPVAVVVAGGDQRVRVRPARCPRESARIGRRRLVTERVPGAGKDRADRGAQVLHRRRNSPRSCALKAQKSTTWLPCVLTISSDLARAQPHGAAAAGGKRLHDARRRLGLLARVGHRATPQNRKYRCAIGRLCAGSHTSNSPSAVTA